MTTDALVAAAHDAERDTARRLFALYEAALAARPYVHASARTQLRPTRLQLRRRAPDVLEALDAALADAGEILYL